MKRSAPVEGKVSEQAIAMLAIKNLVSRSQTTTVDGLGEIEYTAPGDLYPYAWGWDAAVHAIGYSYFSIDRALAELRASVGGQAKNGMIPHITFYKDTPSKRYYPGPTVWSHSSQYGVPISGISQPPLFACALETVIQRMRDQGMALESRAGVLHLLADSALAYHEWWYRERDLHGTGVVVSTHPWETGMDNSGAWIDALAQVSLRDVPSYTRVDVKPDGSNRDERPTDKFYDQATVLLSYQRDNGTYSFRNEDGFVAKRIAGQMWQMGDIGINSILQRANYALFEVLEALGRDEDAARVKEWIRCASEGIERLLWNEEMSSFVSYDFVARKQVSIVTSGSFLAFYARVGTSTQQSKMAAILMEWCQSGKVQYLVPSTTPDHALFDPVKYWLGPVWPHVNKMIAEGLQAVGQTAAARQVVSDSLELLENHGLKEYYNPLKSTGQDSNDIKRGLGAGDFGFSSAVYPSFLELARQLDLRGDGIASGDYLALYDYVKSSM